MQTLNELLPRYQSRDTRRPAFMHPHQEDGKVIATNSDIMLIAPVTHFAPVPEPYDGTWADWKSVMPQDCTDTPVYTVSAAKLMELYPSDRQTPIYPECPTCDGCGSVECPCCGSDKMECKACRGSGTNGPSVGNYINTCEVVAKLEGVIFDFTYLQLLADTAMALGVDAIGCHLKRDRHSNMFRIADVEVLLMPISPTIDLDHISVITIPTITP